MWINPRAALNLLGAQWAMNFSSIKSLMAVASRLPLRSGLDQPDMPRQSQAYVSTIIVIHRTAKDAPLTAVGLNPAVGRRTGTSSWKSRRSRSSQ